MQEARVTGAKVVQGKSNTESLEVCGDGACKVEIVDKSGLRQFDCEVLQVKLRLVCHVMDQARQGAVVQLRGRKIDGKPKVLRKCAR
jgi:hypothetical protein